MARELKITPLIIRGEDLKAQGFGGQCKRAEGNSGEKSKEICLSINTEVQCYAVDLTDLKLVD